MLRFVRPFLLVALTAAVPSTPASVRQGASPNIAGVWVLNPSLTQRPEEIGFSPDWARAGVPQVSRESVDDSTRVQQLTGEARTPPAQLSIVQKDNSVSIADDQGHSRTFHPDGKLEALTLGTVALPTTARWERGSLVVLYDVQRGRQVRYIYTPEVNPQRLLVEIRFLERGREGDSVRLTYEPPGARDRAILSGATPPPAAPAPSPASSPASDTVPPSARPPVLPPGSELRGLTTIGTQVEDLGAQATACGLDQTKVKASITRILGDAGFKTDRFGNEETYVLISIVTSRLPDGTCVSRYDASLVSQADATLPYLKGLVAVDVQLLHEGGMAGGSPAAHATAVMDALAKSVSGFVSRIRAASK
jgi:hypothetical protein